MKTDNMIEIEKAFCGYTPTGRAYVPYTGNLTKQKELDICKKLIANGYRPGWKSSNIKISNRVSESGLSSYQEDGGAGGYTKIEVLN